MSEKEEENESEKGSVVLEETAEKKDRRRKVN